MIRCEFAAECTTLTGQGRLGTKPHCTLSGAMRTGARDAGHCLTHDGCLKDLFRDTDLP